MNKDHSIFSYLLGWFSILFGKLTLSDLSAIIGAVATVIGLIITWRYKYLDYKLKKRQVEGCNNESKPKE